MVKLSIPIFNDFKQIYRLLFEAETLKADRINFDR